MLPRSGMAVTGQRLCVIRAVRRRRYQAPVEGEVGAQMRAARLKDRGQLICETAPTPHLGEEPGHVLVRTLLASICGSDLHVVHHDLSHHDMPGPAGYPGHEGIGEVVASTDPAFRGGERVLTFPPSPEARGFADYQLLPAQQVLPVPAALSTEQALLAQQLGTVLFAIKRFWPRDGARSVTILGAGSAGLLWLQEVRRRGVDVVVLSEPQAARRAMAVNLGADVVVDPATRTAAEATWDATDGRGADLVIDAAGYDDARVDAAGAVADGGTLGCFGLPEGPGLAPFPFELLFRRRVTIHAEYGAQEELGRTSFRAALDQIDRGVTDVSGMLTHRFAIERLEEAFAVATDRRDGAIKVGIEFD